MDRFWSKVDMNPHHCWEWQKGTYSGGYGCFNPGGGAPQVYAHRFAYELANGPIPKGLLVRHKCDNRLCCNPAHLELGTIADNTRDMNERGRNGHSAKTQCPYGHPYDAVNTYILPSNRGRACRICAKRRSQEFQQRRRAQKP